MAIGTFNPYPLIGNQLVAGMDAVSAAVTPTSSVDEFVNAIYNYIQPIFYPSTAGTAIPSQLEIEIKSVIYNVINAYSSKVINKLPWTAQQMNFISMMLGLTTTNNVPINAIDTWFNDIQNNISDANQSIDDQTPLLLGIRCGTSIYAYWNRKVATPGSWSAFFQTPAPLNYANIPLWSTACIEGALIGANASEKGLIAPTTDITSVNIISALIGAIAIGAGKVIFRWVPEILPLELVEETFIGGFSPAFGSGLQAFGIGKNEKDCKENTKCVNKGDCSNNGCTNWQCTVK
ncbi:MAG: hypothetical protein IPM51_10515 [Sphingobacteriaceae bacterium]|nr:hypothetical protein [Sphingobacteriaceae bacterium]